MIAPPMMGAVQAVFDACTAPVRASLLELRSLIFARAALLPDIGPVTEGLRWGQPAYLTPDTGAGCSLRIGPMGKGGFALFVHCRTDLIETFLAGPGAGMKTQGTRAVLFHADEGIATIPVSMLIDRALTYHLPAAMRT